MHLKHLLGVLTRRMNSLKVENLEQIGIDGREEELNDIRDKSDVLDEEVGIFELNYSDVAVENAPMIVNEHHDAVYWANKLNELHTNVDTHRVAIQRKIKEIKVACVEV